MYLGKNIRYLRKKSSFSQDEIAEKLGYKSYTTIQKWETGDSEPPLKKTKILAEIFDVDMDDLVNVDLELRDSRPRNLIPLQKVRYVPVIGRIACGTPILADQNIVDHILLPDHIKADFALQAVGDSMTGAQIDDQDYVYIRSQPEVENGEIAAVLIGEEATLKKVYREDDKLTLLPANQKHDPFVYVKDEIKRVRIIGKAVAVLKNLE